MSVLNEPLIFLDIETTGWSYKKDKIIEIFASKMVNGTEIDKFYTLLNPCLNLPSSITHITGINYSELANAPKFDEISFELFSFLENHTIVAHNAIFDHSFLKREFINCGYELKNKYLCTVKLSRKLYPKFKKHGLDHVIQRVNFEDGDRHRAEYDTLAIKKFFYMCVDTFDKDVIDDALTKALSKKAEFNNIDTAITKNIPETPGIYIFEDKNSYPLYIGMSKNIKKRVIDHLYKSVNDEIDLNINKYAQNIKYIETNTVFASKIYESIYIKNLSPLYNKKLRKKSSESDYIVTTDKNGYYTIKSGHKNLKTIKANEKLLFITGGKKFLDFLKLAYIKKYGLCSKLLGVDTSKNECFYYGLGYCSGACIQKINPETYNKVFLEAFDNLIIPAWPFNGPIIFKNDLENLLFYNWSFIGSNKGKGTNISLEDTEFDIDIYKLIKDELDKDTPFIVTEDFLDINEFRRLV